MIRCAKLDDQNTVTKIIVVSESNGIAWCMSKLSGHWVLVEQTPETNELSAVIGSVYDEATQTFTYPQKGLIDGQENI